MLIMMLLGDGANTKDEENLPRGSDSRPISVKEAMPPLLRTATAPPGPLPPHRVHDLQHGCDARASVDYPKVPRGPLLGGILLQDGMDGELSMFVKGNLPCIITTIEYGHKTVSRIGMKQGMINGKMHGCISYVLAGEGFSSSL
jgi:hypothetical protein